MDIVDVVRLSVLSRRWKSLWMTTPYLNFEFNCFRRPQDNLGLRGQSEKFTRVIHWVLMCQGSTQLNRFCLCHHDFDEKDIMMWTRVAALRNVKEFQLDWGYGVPEEELELPNCLVTCESLRVLKLNLQFSVLKVPNSLKFKHLTSLYLKLVEFSDDDLARRLFSHCSFLEELSLIDFLVTDLKVLDISSSSLKRLTLGTYNEYDEYPTVHRCELKISCPSLISIDYDGGAFRSYHFDNVSSLDTVSINIFADSEDCPREEVGHRTYKFLEQLEDIRVLEIIHQSMWYPIAAIKDLQCFSATFRRLESLYLSVSPDGRCTQAMFLLLNLCPYLESLTVSQYDEDSFEDTAQNENWQLDDEANANWGHRLKLVEWFRFGGEEHELVFVKFMLRAGHVLERFKIVWWEYSEKSYAEVREKVLEFPKASSLVKVKFYQKK